MAYRSDTYSNPDTEFAHQFRREFIASAVQSIMDRRWHWTPQTLLALTDAMTEVYGNKPVTLKQAVSVWALKIWKKWSATFAAENWASLRGLNAVEAASHALGIRNALSGQVVSGHGLLGNNW